MPHRIVWSGGNNPLMTTIPCFCSVAVALLMFESVNISLLRSAALGEIVTALPTLLSYCKYVDSVDEMGNSSSTFERSWLGIFCSLSIHLQLQELMTQARFCTEITCTSDEEYTTDAESSSQVASANSALSFVRILHPSASIP